MLNDAVFCEIADSDVPLMTRILVIVQLLEEQKEGGRKGGKYTGN